MILCAFVLLCSLAEAQTGGACQSAQALVCAGNFIGTISTTRYPMRNTGDLCPYSEVGSGILYTSQYGGSYEDFTNMPQGLGWYDVDAGSQTLYATDSCFVPCSSSAPGITGPLYNCPNPNGASVAGAKATWTGQQTVPDGNLMGEQPYFESGGINPTFDCSDNTAQVATGPVTFIQVTVHKCKADYRLRVSGLTWARPLRLIAYSQSKTAATRLRLVPVPVLWRLATMAPGNAHRQARQPPTPTMPPVITIARVRTWKRIITSAGLS